MFSGRSSCLRARSLSRCGTERCKRRLRAAGYAKPSSWSTDLAARTVMGFLLSGGFRRYPDIKFVFSHSGGAIPMFAGRFNRLLQATDISKVAPNGLTAEFRKLYYETANANSPPTMAALMKFAPLGQILFGSDHPYVTDSDNMSDLKRCGLSPREMSAILYENAQRLVPQLKA